LQHLLIAASINNTRWYSALGYGYSKVTAVYKLDNYLSRKLTHPGWHHRGISSSTHIPSDWDWRSGHRGPWTGHQWGRGDPGSSGPEGKGQKVKVSRCV